MTRTTTRPASDATVSTTTTSAPAAAMTARPTVTKRSRIEWTDQTWNVVTGCTRVSPGCDRCYADAFLRRWDGVPGHPFTTGFAPTTHPDRLGQPLRWRTPRRVFVAALGDLFHHAVPDEFIAAVFAVMAATPQHTYQILTKRHARMCSFLRDECRCGKGHVPGVHLRSAMDWAATPRNPAYVPGLTSTYHTAPWPLPNVWLGVSVETQRWADIRVPALLDTPAALRWVSCEPLLGPLDLSLWFKRPQRSCQRCHVRGPLDWHSAHLWGNCTCPCHPPPASRPEWVVVGGESGPGARPLDPVWVRRLVDLGDVAQVPVFVKQLGSAWARSHGQTGRAGDPADWPPALRVRHYPSPRHSIDLEELLKTKNEHPGGS